MSTTSNNSTSSINDTVQSALRASGYESYARYAEPVVIALQAREMEIADKLIDYAVDANMDPDEVRRYLSEVGLIVRPVVGGLNGDEPAPGEQDQLSRIEQMLRGLTDQVGSLTTFARANGYRG